MTKQEKQQLSESDICDLFITPAIKDAGWNQLTQIRREVTLTPSPIVVRGNMSSRNKKKKKFADYVLLKESGVPIAIVEAKDNSHTVIDASYLWRYMLSASFLVQAVKTDTRVAMPKINQTELNAIAVPVPPLAEQRRIVAKVEQLMASVDALETQLATSRATAEKLLSALVAKLTGTKNAGQASKPAASAPARRGRPRKA